MREDHIIEPSIRQAFDNLDELSAMDRDKLIALYNDTSVKSNLILLAFELLGISLDSNSISSYEIPKLVYVLYNAKKSWSQDLMKVIIMETRKSKEGESESAGEILKDFINRCDSPFYKRIAKRRLDSYKQQ